MSRRQRPPRHVDGAHIVDFWGLSQVMNAMQNYLGRIQFFRYMATNGWRSLRKKASIGLSLIAKLMVFLHSTSKYCSEYEFVQINATWCRSIINITIVCIFWNKIFYPKKIPFRPEWVFGMLKKRYKIVPISLSWKIF